MRFRPGAQVRRIRLGIVVTSCAVVACAPAPDRALHDVGYYRQHTYERNREVYVCANDTGSLGKQPDCVNAREAARIEGIGSLHSLTPMDLPVPPVTQP
jgi:hypothetical protein